MSGKSVLVTGAGGGIGRATALRMAREGAAVAVTDRDVKLGRGTVAQLESEGLGLSEFVELDVTDEQSWSSGVKQAVDRFGQIDVLVNNAGVYLIGSLVETSVHDWHRVMDINACGVFLGMRAVAPMMGAAGGGSIVNISSTTALGGILRRTAYAASKAAVRVMSQCVAVEYAPVGVRVNTVFPGFTRTAIADEGARDAGLPVDEIGWNVTPLGRIAEADDIANACLYLASDEARHVTGAELVVDGGLTCGPNDPAHVDPLTSNLVRASFQTEAQ